MFVVEFVHADSEIGAPLTPPPPTTSFCAPRHAAFLLLDYLGNTNDHRGKLSLASVEDVAVGEGAASSSRAWARLTSASIVTEAAAWRSASSMRANSP